MKICSRCKLNKDDSEFRIRVDKRYNPPFVYLNNTCKKCDAALTRAYTKRHNKNPIYLEKRRIKSRDYARNNKDKIRIRLKNKRQTCEYKNYVKQYTVKHKDRITKQHKNRNKKYVDRIRKNIEPIYVKRIIATADWQVRSPKDGRKKNRYLNKNLEEIQVQILTTRIKKIIKCLKYE